MSARSSRTWGIPCLTMHQPWASLLVHGIKRIEGRSWPAPLKGRVWIHAAGKVPDAPTIQTMENFYKQIYALDGIHDLEFPRYYPVSRLLGCVEVVGCLKGAELETWEAVPMGVRLEALTDFCWLCENPMRLSVPIEMRGNQGVYELDSKIYDRAMRSLLEGKDNSGSMKFPLPMMSSSSSTSSLRDAEVGSSNIIEAIAGARAAATQFSRRPDTSPHHPVALDLFPERRRRRPDPQSLRSLRHHLPPLNLRRSPS